MQLNPICCCMESGEENLSSVVLNSSASKGREKKRFQNKRSSSYLWLFVKGFVLFTVFEPMVRLAQNVERALVFRLNWNKLKQKIHVQLTRSTRSVLSRLQSQSYLTVSGSTDTEIGMYLVEKQFCKILGKLTRHYVRHSWKISCALFKCFIPFVQSVCWLDEFEWNVSL